MLGPPVVCCSPGRSAETFALPLLSVISAGTQALLLVGFLPQEVETVRDFKKELEADMVKVNTPLRTFAQAS